MKAQSRKGSAYAVVLLVVALGMGCNGDGDDSPGPGGSTISGNVSTASTASLGRSSNSLFAWVRENLLGFARTVYAQALDTSLDGVTVIVRGDGRESSDLTGTTGDFIITNAPTGDIDVLFRRGGCEATLPLGNVISNSTIILEDTAFNCPAGTGTGSAEADGIFEGFTGVLRNEDDPEDAVTFCVRTGSSNRDRDVDLTTGRLEDESGSATSYAAFRDDDLVEIHGERLGPGDAFNFIADLVQIRDRDVRDECANPL